MARETACLTLEDRLAVDEMLAADHDAFEAMGEREVIGKRAGRGGAAGRGVRDRPPAQGRVRAAGLDPARSRHDGLAERPAARGRRRGRLRRSHPRGRQRPRAGRPAHQGPGDGRRAGPSRRWEPTAATAAATPVRRRAPSTSASSCPTRRCSARPTTTAQLAGFGPIPAELAREIVAERPRRGRGGLAPSALRLPDDRRARRDGQPGPPVPRRPRPAHQAARPGLPHPVVRRPDPPRRPRRATRRRRRPPRARNGQGLCEACNYAKQAPRWRAETRAGRHRDHHDPDRPHPHHQTATARDCVASRGAASHGRLRPDQLTERPGQTRVRRV